MNSFPGRGDVRDLRLGEYMRSPTTVWYRCASCGETTEIGGRDYGITVGGDVRPAYVCPVETCRAEVALTLVDWSAR